ncbi:MAG TPA: EAL domain-containing protein [Acidimicrobiia bacterium]|nr:EAL domain-containing protein [Acidimicrobiia bacterium]
MPAPSVDPDAHPPQGPAWARSGLGSPIDDSAARRVLRARSTPWLLLAGCVTVSVVMWGQSLRIRDANLRARDARSGSEAAAATQEAASATQESVSTISTAVSSIAGRAASAPVLTPSLLQSWVSEDGAAADSLGIAGFTLVQPTDDPDQYSVTRVDEANAPAVPLPIDELEALRPALERSRSTETAALTGAFPFVAGAATEDAADNQVFAVVAPVGRAENFLGWIGAIVDGDRFTDAVLSELGTVGSLTILDAPTTAQRAQVVGEAHSPDEPGTDDVVTQELTVADHELLLRSQAIPARGPNQAADGRSWELGLALGASLLLFLLAELVRRNERRAHRAVLETTRSLTESERRFRTLVTEQDDIVLVIDTGVTIRWANETATRALGYPVSELVGQPGLDFVHPEDRPEAIDSLANLLGPEDDDHFEMRVRTRDGEHLHMEVRGTDLSADPAIDGVVVNLRDITDRRRVEHDLAEANARFQIAFEHAPIGMAVTTPEGIILRVNPALSAMLDQDADRIVGLRAGELVHPDHRQDNGEDFRRLVTGEIGEYRIERQLLHDGGRPVWAAITMSAARAPDGEAQYLIAQIEDITERKAIADQLAHQAVHDPTTGLPNRLQFFDRLRMSLDQGSRRGTRVGIIFIDLDHFKWVNDSHGHAVGDQVLTTVGDRLRAALRPSDSVARLGGDEFTVLCPDVVDEATLMAVAERMFDVVTKPIPLLDGEVFLTPSLGVALGTPDDVTPESLLSDADKAMYRAKQSGRARIELFDTHAPATSGSSVRSTALHHALEREELEVFYQPNVDLGYGRVMAMEALLRWHHPERGLVGASDFVPLAEETGLIVPIGLWVLEEACRQTMAWQAAAPPGTQPLFVSVNLSPRQLAETSLAGNVAEILDRTGIDPDTVWLEITETALMHDAESAGSALRSLRTQGLHLAVDDFGTGYSSLLYLKRFPVEVLKVDRTFVDGLGRDPEDTAIVGGVISLAHAMGLAAVAEGVESVDQLRELQRLGCDVGQGYLFGRPRSAADIGAYPTNALTDWPMPDGLISPRAGATAGAGTNR